MQETNSASCRIHGSTGQSFTRAAKTVGNLNSAQPAIRGLEERLAPSFEPTRSLALTDAEHSSCHLGRRSVYPQALIQISGSAENRRPRAYLLAPRPAAWTVLRNRSWDTRARVSGRHPHVARRQRVDSLLPAVRRSIQFGDSMNRHGAAEFPRKIYRRAIVGGARYSNPSKAQVPRDCSAIAASTFGTDPRVYRGNLTKQEVLTVAVNGR